MAEGGRSPESPPVDNTPPALLEQHLLDCPICLEQLRQPRRLPCLHSLCEECLNCYIVKEVSGTDETGTSFTCPVCRALTHPPDKSEDKENWAKQFPIDSHATEMIQMANQTPGPYQCKPCQKKGDITPARFWCGTNKLFFCQSCKVDLHDMIHDNCSPVEISEPRRFDPNNKEASYMRCHQHHKKNHYYCEDHKSLGCSKCMIADHRRCTNVSQIESFCEKLESTRRLDDVRNGLQQGVATLTSLIQDYYLQLKSISDDKDLAFKGIDDFQEQMIKCIAEKRREITDELISAYKKEQEQLTKSSKKCERLKRAVENTLESSAVAQQQKDLTNIVLLYQRGKAEVESCKNLVDELLRNFSTTMIDHEIQSNVSQIGAVLNLGKVVVERKKRTVPDGLHVTDKPLSARKMIRIRKIYIKCPSDTTDCCIYGVVYLPDGRIVVSDHKNRKLKLISCGGDVVNELKVNEKPWDICLVDNTTIAAAVVSPGGIRIVTVAPSSLTLTTEINIGGSCYSVAYRNGEFIVCTGSHVCTLSKNGTIHKLCKCDGICFGMSYDSKHGHLFITHFSGGAISRLSDDNKETEVLKAGVLGEAVGVDVDDDDNVYICGSSSNNVIQISGDGNNIRELLTAADGITKPTAISVCGNKIVVTNDTVDQRNYITLFQLA